jgi:enoyl-CoA hydratase/carnithine racemase
MDQRIGDIHVRLTDTLAQVTIDRPPSNAVSVDLLRDLADTLEKLDRDGVRRAVVLAAAGRVFSSGADLSGRAEVSQQQASAQPAASPAAQQDSPLYEQAIRLFSTDLPIIAAVQGAAVGAGLGLTLVADFRIAAPEARFSANFTRLGFHPGFGLTYTLPRLIGQQNAARMFLTGDRFDAQTALGMGLVDEVVPAGELLARAHALASSIAQNAPLAVRATRRTLRRDLAEAVRAQTRHEFAEQAWLMQTEDFREGVRAVSERRPGDFRGR